MKKGLMFIILLLAVSQTIWAQGIVRGKVTDAETGEELIGANIIIEGTTTGTISDFDGSYSLENLSPGTYNIVCSFISYDKLTVTGIEVKDGEVTLANFKLGTASEIMGDVVITAKTNKKSEAALLTIQRKSANVLDAIGAQQMSRLGDSDAAGALKRVTGISVTGGKYVYVRGLSDRYTITTLNNAEIPGLDPNRNTVQMDLFPSNIIENIVVRKTFSPDMPGTATGGQVNIVTKDFPEKFTLQLSTSLGFNPQNNLNEDFLSYQGGNTDWLGFDDGIRDIPALAEDEIPSVTSQPEKVDEITKSFNKIWEPESQQSFLNHSHSFSVGNRINLFGKPLGFNAALSYSRDFEHIDNGFEGRYAVTSRDAANMNSQIVLDKDTASQEEVMWSALVNLNYKLSDKHKIGLIVLRNQNGISLARRQEGTKNSDEAGMLYQTRTLQYLQRSFTSGQLKGEHVIEALNNFKIDWFGSYTMSTQEEPDLRFFTNHYTKSGGYEIQQSLYPIPTRYFRDMEELNLDGKIDLTLPINIGKSKTKIKAGGAFVYKDRDFNEAKYQFPENSNTYNGSVSEYMQDENIVIVDPETNLITGLYILNEPENDKKNSYTGQQSVIASYGMVDAPIGKLRLIAGARVELTDIEAENKAERYLNKSSVKRDYLDVLPSINLTYELIKNMNLRAAYTRTLARPTFRELMPLATFAFVGDYTTVGNDNLERTLIDNIDLRWEYFMTPGEIVSVSGFYKMFQNPIERAFNTEAANPELTWRNVEQANILGLELELRKHLNFVSALKGLRAGVNFTYVKSIVSIDGKELESKRYYDADFDDTRVMFEQSPYIVNASLSYDNDSLGLSLNLGYNWNGEKLAAINAVGIPDIYEQPRGRMDASVSKKFGEHISLKFAVKNITDQTHENFYSYRETDYIYRRYNMGRTFSLGFTYLID